MAVNMFQVDCMEFMRNKPDKYYDLVIVDPEYGINASKGTWGTSNLSRVKDYGKKDWDNESVRAEILEEIIRVSENQIVWGANHFISKIPFDSSCWIVWDKVNTGNFADCELAWTSFNSAVRKFTFIWNGMIQGNPKNGSIPLGNKKQNEKRIHPTQKPVALYKWLLKNYANPGDKILDTHSGSMSIAIACYDLMFDLDICELDPDYFRGAKARFENHVAKYAPAGEIPVDKKGQAKLF
jgi:site-specific DNA-methyltransferase (adenine-specific)